LITYNSQDPQSKNFFAKIRMHAASLVMMYDQFFRLSLALNETPRLRLVIENDIPQEKKWLTTFYQTAIEESRWKDSQADILALVQEEKLRGGTPLDESELIFESYIQQSFTAQRLRSKDDTYRLGQVLDMQRQLNSGRLTDRLQRLIGKISQIFGNSIGSIQTRDGKLKKLASDVQKMKSLKEKLKPLDILFEKTPMRLTDRFIPGFYGHVAIWIGPVSEWSHYFVRYQRAIIPITEHPAVKAVLPQLLESKGVLEALRLPGVTLNTIEHFMDIDDLLIIRQETLAEDLKGEMIVKALEQYGKPSDFNFDVETQREIVCSELAYVVYDQESWPTSHQLGRYTISPDQVAFKVLDHHFEPILMYHDGVEVKGEMREKLRSLLEAPGGIAKFVN
ncbi:MAG: hypothetical protein K2P81_03605, partial [Bacteriovoracaceae bacterium]|nr:hypothetical protein [Bacteriovoracaceae bacterium]